MEVVKLPNWDYSIPLSIHLLITTRCNLACPECFYKQKRDATMSQHIVSGYLNEWRAQGVQSVAIGGGEPMTHVNIVSITRYAKMCGLYVAVTTNGTILKHIQADRVHISYDKLHAISFEQLKKAVKFYKTFVPKVGINHVVTDLESVREIANAPVDTITLLMQKPKTDFTDWKQAFALIPKTKLWIDACLAQKLGIRNCRQGKTSMSINAFHIASKCSNIKQGYLYMNLKDAWRKVRTQTCPFFWVKQWEKY